MQNILTNQTGLRISQATPRLVSQGYAFVGDVKVFVQVFHMPVLNNYCVKLKLPKHKTLHLWWPGAEWRFENEWLTFPVQIDDPFAAKYYDGWQSLCNIIRNTLQFVAFT